MLELKPHNRTAYKKVSGHFQNGIKSVIYVSGVGTGKSFVFMAVAGDIKGKILYIIPKHAITNNLQSYAEFADLAGRVDFATYNAFTDKAKGRELIRGYSLIVIDECHHLGSDRYGKAIASLMEERGTRFLRLTATPVRDTDKFDVSSCFEERVDGITNFKAIEDGLMPAIEYRVCLPERNLRQVEKEYGGGIKAVLSYEESEDVLAGAARSFPCDKWICFFPNVKTLNSHKGLVKKIFPEHKIFTLYSGLGNLDEVINGLKENGKAAVLSCNILLEGVHLPGIGGIVLFRNVTSLTAFQQMIGRVCSIGRGTSPVVLDCSSCALKLMAKLLAGQKGTGIQPRKRPGAPGREIVRIGIGEHRHYDIGRLLALAQGAAVTEKEENAVRKYESFKGKRYKSREDLEKNRADCKKLKACCELYGASFTGAVALLTAS